MQSPSYPSILYKYYPIKYEKDMDISNKDSLVNKLFGKETSLKFSPIYMYNDAFEFLPANGSKLSPEIIEDTLNYVIQNKQTARDSMLCCFLEKLYRSIEHEVPRFTSLDSLSKEDKDLLTFFMSEYVKKCVLCSCFSVSPLIDLMWAHYAASHQGFCVGYLTTYLKQMKSYNLKPVIYKNKRVKIDITKNPMQGTEKLHLVKGKSWDYEKEWRMYRADEKPFMGVEYEKINIQCIHSIHFGIRTASKYKQLIMNKLSSPDSPDVKTYQIEVNYKTFSLNQIHIIF